MSLDFSLYEVKPCEVFTRNITHNLTTMAEEAGLYTVLWHSGGKTATDIIPALKDGLDDLKTRPDFYRQFNAPNGWGKYENFVDFVAGVLAACEENPAATIMVCR